jgi:hypothetical protein
VTILNDTDDDDDDDDDGRPERWRARIAEAQSRSASSARSSHGVGKVTCWTLLQVRGDLSVWQATPVVGCGNGEDSAE